MGIKERFGCFLIAVGAVISALIVFPILQILQQDPLAVPLEWIGIAGLAVFLLWAGVRLFLSARRSDRPGKPPSLGARIASHWNSEGEENRDSDRPGRR